MIDQVNKVTIYGRFIKGHQYDRTLDGVDYYMMEFVSHQTTKKYEFRVKILMTMDLINTIDHDTEYRILGELVVSTKFSNFIIMPKEVTLVSELEEVGRYVSSIEITVKLVKIIDSYKSRNLMIALGRFDSEVAKGQHVRLLCYARTGAFVNSVLIPDYEYVTVVNGYFNSLIVDDQSSTSVVVTKFTLDPNDETKTNKASEVRVGGAPTRVASEARDLINLVPDEVEVIETTETSPKVIPGVGIRVDPEDFGFKDMDDELKKSKSPKGKKEKKKGKPEVADGSSGHTNDYSSGGFTVGEMIEASIKIKG